MIDDTAPRKASRAMYLSLGLEPGAPSAEIKRAYRNLSLKLHPDASQDPGTAVRFAVVAKAYETLSFIERDRPRRATKAVAGADTFDLISLGTELSSAIDPELRRSAATRLGLSGKRSAWLFLRKGLYDKDPAVVESCVRAAAVLGLAQGSGEIAGAYERGSSALRDRILETAAATGDALFSAALEVAKNDDDPRRRVHALAQLRDRRKAQERQPPTRG